MKQLITIIFMSFFLLSTAGAGTISVTGSAGQKKTLQEVEIEGIVITEEVKRLDAETMNDSRAEAVKLYCTNNRLRYSLNKVQLSRDSGKNSMRTHVNILLPVDYRAHLRQLISNGLNDVKTKYVYQSVAVDPLIVSAVNDAKAKAETIANQFPGIELGDPLSISVNASDNSGVVKISASIQFEMRQTVNQVIKE